MCYLSLSVPFPSLLFSFLFAVLGIKVGLHTELHPQGFLILRKCLSKLPRLSLTLSSSLLSLLVAGVASMHCAWPWKFFLSRASLCRCACFSLVGRLLSFSSVWWWLNWRRQWKVSRLAQQYSHQRWVRHSPHQEMNAELLGNFWFFYFLGLVFFLTYHLWFSKIRIFFQRPSVLISFSSSENGALFSLAAGERWEGKGQLI